MIWPKIRKLKTEVATVVAVCVPVIRLIWLLSSRMPSK